MSLAIAMEESSQNHGSVLFSDRRKEFSWHSGLMFKESMMQVSFLKDLVTMVNPRSKYTFLNFIKESNRIHEFINLRTFYPRRTEFDSYLRWAKNELGDISKFDHEIINIEFSNKGDLRNSQLKVSVKENITNNIHDIIVKNIVIADGGTTNWSIKLNKDTAKRVFHGEETLHRLKTFDLARNKEYIFHIVGAGQSSADIIEHLTSEYPNSKIIITHKSFSMIPEDDSHFVNEIFMPNAVDMFLSMDEASRSKVLSDNKHVTHNGVTIDLIPKIYEKMYYDKIDGNNKYQFNKFSEVVDCEEIQNGVLSTVRNIHTNETYKVKSDFTIMATGYKRECPHPLLKNIDDSLLKIANNSYYDIDENYRIKTSTDVDFNIYMQGYAENSHGFSETLLSLMAERSQKILKSIES